MKTSPEEVFRASGGQLRMSEAVRRGISRRMLYSLKTRGIIERISRGIYRLADLPAMSSPDLAVVGARYPKAVVCLVSALAYHEMTTQVPHTISVALPEKAWQPKADYPPLTVHYFAKQAYQAGVEERDIDGVAVKFYSPEKTLADCFKFRNKIGMDVVLEALKFYRERKKLKLEKLLEYAKICRVRNVMRPYLEASL